MCVDSLLLLKVPEKKKKKKKDIYFYMNILQKTPLVLNTLLSMVLENCQKVTYMTPPIFCSLFLF